jgi:hypothetical protein
MTEQQPAPAFDLYGTGAPPDNSAQIITLRLDAPLRPIAGRTASLDGLALFDAERAPTLI